MANEFTWLSDRERSAFLGMAVPASTSPFAPKVAPAPDQRR
ncbi:hypothetical protein [Sphingomonas sp.]|nr:hypothetical protein [Sphingomonas sp.]